MLYLIHGENQYASLNRLWELKSKFTGAFVVIDGETITDVAEVFASTDTFSMFSTTQLIIVKRFSLNPKKITLERKLVTKLQSMDFQTIDLVFWEPKNLSARAYSYKKKKPAKESATTKKTPATVSFAKFLNDQAQVESFTNLTDNDLQSWIGSELSKQGIINGNQFAAKIIDKAGNDQMILSGELAKLALFAAANKRNRLEFNDLSLVTLYEQTNMVWDLTDAICNRNKPLALSLIESMLRGPEDYPLIFSATLKQLRNVYATKKFSNQKERLMSTLGITPYAYSKLTRFANGFTIEQIQKLYSKLVNLDYTIKQGKIEVKLGLDLLVATL